MEIALNTQTMSSTQLSEMLNFSSKSSINLAIRNMFQVKIDDSTIKSSIDSRGYVSDYYLPELESKMFVAKHDINYLETITKFWIDKGKVEQPLWISQLSPEATIMLNDLSSQLEHKTQQVAHLESLFHSGGTISQFVKQLNGVNSQKVNVWLYAKTKWLYDENKGKFYLSGKKQGMPKPYSWRCASYARDKYLTETNYNVDRQGMDSMVKYEVQLLAKGKKWLFNKYIKNELPMKSDWDGKYTHEKDLK